MAEKILCRVGTPDKFELKEGLLSAGERQGRCSVTVSCGDYISNRTERSYWHAFRLVRKDLESFHVTPVRYGSTINIHTSGMTADSTGGVLAYRLYMDRESSRGDLVNIFDPVSHLEIGTVKEQDRFYKRWLRRNYSWWNVRRFLI